MIQIDIGGGTIRETGPSGERTYPLGSPEAFAVISRVWLRCGWDTKYVYGFTWLGRPIIQLPEDMFRIQEVIYSIKPDVLIETGVAHGGSLVFYASLFRSMGRGRVIGIDVEIRPHNRKAIESHELSRMITLIEGSSVAPEVVAQARGNVRPGETVLVVLDSNHTKAHVLAELRAYSSFVSKGSYLVATDGIMRDLVGAPRSRQDWSWNNPASAAAEFVHENGDFVIEEPRFPFNEGSIQDRVTYWPSCYLRRIR